MSTTPWVTVPASSANLGPGFDTLGLALDLCLEVGVGHDGPSGVVPEGHPAAVAFARLGGEGPLWCRSPIPMGRGLGFSGAARVGGLVAALRQRHGPAPLEELCALDDVLAHATALEGHGDNVAASLLGGVVAVAGGRAVRVPTPLVPAVVVWIPQAKTSTDSSRGTLPGTVPFADAVFNVGRVALLVAALAAGDVGALRAATEDRLHQDGRLALAPASRRALQGALDAGAWGAWLSGSGPTVAALVAPEEAASLASTLPSDGHVKVLAVHTAGTAVVG